MKKIFIAVLFTLLSLAAFAGSRNADIPAVDKNAKDSLSAKVSGTTEDSVDIKQIVLLQIETARKKQTQDSITALKAKSIQSAPVKSVALSQVKVTVKQKSEKTQWEQFVAYTEPVIYAMSKASVMTIKLAIIGAFSCIAFFVVFVRRKKISLDKTKKNDIKDSIKLIREEKVKDKKNKSLSFVRNKLIGSTSTLQLSSDSVSKHARELNISKGEIYLAARIKLHELKKVNY
jgi:hypothetical protein